MSNAKRLPPFIAFWDHNMDQFIITGSIILDFSLDLS